MNIDAVAEAIWRADHEGTVDVRGLQWEKSVYREHYRRMAQAAIDALQLTQVWAVSSGDGWQDDIVREHWDMARDDLAETIAAGDEGAYIVTAWATGWVRIEGQP